MERLTRRLNNNKIVAIKGDSCDYNAYSFDCQTSEERKRLKTALEKLANYEDLEEQGLLVRLPCKVGDILFRINKGARNPIIKMKVSHITIKSKSYSIKAIEEDYGEVLFSNNVIGKTVFLTREDAEKKLEEMIK
jgi:hypothetical protein